MRQPKEADKRNGAERAEGTHVSQREALIGARQKQQNSGRAGLTIQGMDGRLRDKDTIAPCNDPCPLKDGK